MTVEQVQAAKSKRTIFLVIMILFVVAWIATAIFGYIVVGNVRDTADDTDRNMRALAWASLAFACEHDGRFPSDEDELLSVQPLPESIPCVPATAGAWPTKRIEAFEGAHPPDLAGAAARLQLHFSSDGRFPPVVGNNGLPTRLGTQDEIKGWLWAFDEAKDNEG